MPVDPTFSQQEFNGTLLIPTAPKFSLCERKTTPTLVIPMDQCCMKVTEHQPLGFQWIKCCVKVKGHNLSNSTDPVLYEGERTPIWMISMDPVLYEDERTPTWVIPMDLVPDQGEKTPTQWIQVKGHQPEWFPNGSSTVWRWKDTNLSDSMEQCRRKVRGHQP